MKSEKLFPVFARKAFARGQTIAAPGPRPKNLYYLKSGLVQQYSQSRGKETLVIHQYRPGSFFYLRWLTSSEQNPHYFKAITAVTVYVVPREKAKKILTQNPEFLWETTQRLIAGVNGLAKRLEIVTLSPASFRVASLLSYLEKKYGRPLPFKLTHKEIASWIGTARETVSLEMSRLKKAGKIKN